MGELLAPAGQAWLQQAPLTHCWFCPQHTPVALGLFGSVHSCWAQQTPCAALELPWHVCPDGQQIVPLEPVQTRLLSQQVPPLVPGTQIWPVAQQTSPLPVAHINVLSQQVLPLMHC